MNQKKFLSIFLLFSLLSVGNSINASESNSNNYSQIITRDTVITENNLNDVLKYLNIDPSEFIKTDTSNLPSVTTVGEVQDLIEQEKNSPDIEIVS